MEDLWPLSHLASLRVLDVSDNAVADVTPLQHLPALSALARLPQLDPDFS